MDFKIKVSTIPKFLIELLVMMHLCYFFILFGNTSLFADSYVPKTRMMIFFAIMIVAMVVGSRYVQISLSRFLFFELLLLAVACARGFLGAETDGYAWDDSLSMLRIYLYPFLAVTILGLLVPESWSFDKLLKFLTVATTFDTFARAIASIVEHFTGAIPWPNLVVGSMGYRNEIYRINPSNLDIVIIPLAFYLYQKAKKRYQRWIWIGCIAFNYLYSFCIWQARSAIVYKLAVLIVLFYVQNGMTRKKIMQILVGILVAVIAINLTSVNSFFDSFSTSNAELGGSTLARLNSSTYYLAQYKQSLFWGVGLLESSQRYAVGGGTLGDIGFLCAVVQLGVPIIMFYLCIFIRGFYVSYKVREVDRTGSNLVLSLTMLYVMFGINIDTFYGFSLSVPFYLAIVEYIGGNGRSRDFIDY